MNRNLCLLIILLLSIRKVSTTASCPYPFFADSSSPPICYLQIGYTNFDSALSSCKAYNQNSTLPILRNELEWTNMVKLAATANTKNFWLGLTAQPTMTSSSFSWIDGTPRIFDYWENPPSNVNQACVKTHDPSHYQKWITDQCTNTNNYMCQLRTSPCPAGWTQDSSSPPICYLVGPQPKINFNEAVTYCSNTISGAIIPIFRTQTEKTYAVTLFNQLNVNNVWIGLSAPSIVPTIASDSYTWMDGSIRTFNYWDTNPTDVNHRCVITKDSSHNQSWIPTDCNQPHYLMCQIRSSSICAPGYVADASKTICYLFDDNNVTARQAQDFCQSQNPPSNLPIFHNYYNEYYYYVNLAKSLNKYGDRWLGASRPCNVTSISTSFFWMDNINIGTWAIWQSGQPNNDPHSTNIQQNCVVANGDSSFNLNDQQCNVLHMTVCQYRITPSAANYTFSAPLCLVDAAMSCTPLGDPQNGHLIVSDPSFKPGTAANFTCNTGYFLIGPSTVFCQPDISWNDTSPSTCQLNQCSSQPCQNGGTCVMQPDGSYTCNCTTGYWGTNCENTNYCVVGTFNQPGKRRKRLSVVDNAISELNEVSNLGVNTSFLNSTTNLIPKLLNGTLGVLQYIATNLGLPTAPPGKDSCAPNGMCISSTTAAQCLCNDNFFGNRCQYRNCTNIPWSEWSRCNIINCDAGTGTRNRTHTGYSDCNPQYDFQPCTEECRPPDPLSQPARIVATVSQSIGCAILITFISVTFCLFAALRIIFLERMLHMFQEVSLFIGHVTLVVTMKFYMTKTWCSIVGIILQWSFLTNFSFLFLESLQTFCILQNVLSTGGFFSIKINLAVGLGFPFAVTLATAMTMFKSYPSKYSCWVNLDSKIAYATYWPIIALTCTSVILTEAAAMYDLRRLPLTPENKYVAAHVSQKMAVLKIFFNVLTWTVGMNALYFQKVEWYGSLFAINTLLGVVIFVAHTSSNEKVIKFLKSFFHGVKKRTQ